MPRARSSWYLPGAPFPDRAYFSKLHTKVSVLWFHLGGSMTQAKKLYVPVSQKELDLLDSMIETVADMPLVLELGISVSRATVARMALVRGIRSLQANEAPPAVDQAKAAAPPAPEKPSPSLKQDVAPDDQTAFELNSEGLIKPPNGWERWAKGERIPQEQADVHTYYTNHGWERWWGTAGREQISFYWNRNPNADHLDPWPKKSSNNKTVKVQETPWGEGHIVPHGW